MQKKIKTRKAKKYFFLKLFVVSFILLHSPFFNTNVAEAASAWDDVASAIVNPVGAIGGYIVKSTIVAGFEWLLYQLLLILIGFVQVAASVFAWATRPEFISGSTGLLNLDSVYTLWKFIRDFFNLFFIFLLLFSAFATVFQIEQYGLKKNFFKIIFAAIAINFSFPITRMIIDLGNVPMYFFADGIVSGGGGDGEQSLLSIPNAFWQSTHIGDIVLLPSSGSDEMLGSLITAIIFAFIYMITLLTLAFLFVLRLLKLVVLLILSPIGVSASIVPGLKSFGDKWNKELLQTVFFGPMAMFMIVVALRFSLEIQNSDFAKGLSATAPAASGASQSSVIAQGIFFIPVIMMWMAMGVAKKSGLQGADFVTKKTDAAINWGKKAALGTAKYSYKNPVVRGATAGVKERAYEGRLLGDKIKSITGGRLGAKAWKESGEKTEVAAKGFGSKGFEGRTKELNKFRDKKVNEKVKSNKEDKVRESDLLKDLSGKDDIKKRAAAISLSENKDSEVFKAKENVVKALAAVQDDPDNFKKVLQATKGSGIALSADEIDKLVTATTRAQGGNPEDRSKEGQRSVVEKALKNQMEKVGKIQEFIEYKVGVEVKSGLNEEEARSKVFEETEVLKMSAKDLAKQESLLMNTDFKTYAKGKSKFTNEYVNRVRKFALEEGNVELSSHINELNTQEGINELNTQNTNTSDRSAERRDRQREFRNSKPKPKS